MTMAMERPGKPSFGLESPTFESFYPTLSCFPLLYLRYLYFALLFLSLLHTKIHLQTYLLEKLTKKSIERSRKY